MAPDVRQVRPGLPGAPHPPEGPCRLCEVPPGPLSRPTATALDGIGPLPGGARSGHHDKIEGPSRGAEAMGDRGIQSPRADKQERRMYAFTGRG
jgi:hypothetical protein